MNSQVSKMRLISMFYLMVFASALVLSGIFNSQKGFPIVQGKGPSTLFSAVPDSIPLVKKVNVSAESESEDFTKNEKKHDFVPFDVDFSFSSLLQWFFRFPGKTLSRVDSHQKTVPNQDIWLSLQHLRI